MEARFTGRTVIVTGASSGIGVGIATRFAAEGAHVVIAARGNDRLQALADRLGRDRVLPVVTDVTDPESVEAMVRAGVERFGGVDVLVSNAGLGLLKPFDQTTLEDWRLVLSTDLDSCFLGAKAALPHLRASRGSIVQIASASGLGGDRQMSAYNAAKAGVVNLTRALAFDLGPDGIRVNTVAPALTLTAEAAAGYGEWIERFDARRAMPGYSTPDDVGAAVAFLASEDARFITGALLPVDGGVSAGSGQPDLF